MEAKQLHALVGQHGIAQQDVGKLSRFFGAPQGAQSAAKRVLKTLAANMEPGDEVYIMQDAFTVCKHLLIADRVGDTNGERLQESPTVIGCNCFAATYIMVKGCAHKRKALSSDDTYLPTTLCSKCSFCIRCGRQLG